MRVRGVPALACLIITAAAKFTEFWPLGSGSLNKIFRPGGISVFYNAIISLENELLLQLQIGSSNGGAVNRILHVL